MPEPSEPAPDNDERPLRIKDVLIDAMNRVGGDPNLGVTGFRAAFEQALHGDRTPGPRAGGDDDDPATSSLPESAGDSPTPASELPGAPPVAVPHHELIRCLGVGGCGQVWLARQTLTEHFRAVKLIPPERRVELDGLRKLKQLVPAHRNLLAIEEVGESEGWLFILMPLADSAASSGALLDAALYRPATLAELVARRGKLADDEVIAIARDLARAIDHLHTHGVVHGDIKPANIVLVGGTWCLADYGLLTTVGGEPASGFTPGYVPPEGRGTRKADLFALGVVIMVLATGRRPDHLRAYLGTADSRHHDGRAGQLIHIVRRATAPRPDDRPASAMDLLAEADHANSRSGARSQRGLMTLVAGSAVLLAAALVVAGWLITHRPSTAVSPVATVIRSFEIRHVRFERPADNTDPGIDLGPIGRVPAIQDDVVVITGELSQPAYFYLVACDTDGRVKALLPRDGAESRAENSFVFPPEPNQYYSLSGSSGNQGFALIVSDQPLPSFEAWQGSPPRLTWPVLSTAGLNAGGELWLADTRSVHRRAEQVRGEVIGRSAPDSPLTALQATLSRTPGVVDFRAVAFAVLPTDGRGRTGTE